VVEVINCYRGPDHKFRWLVAFAEMANDKTRTGWPSRRLMAWRTEKTASRVSHISAELVADGVLKRTGGGGRGRGNATFELLPLATQKGAPATHSMEAKQGAPATHPKAEVKGAPATHSQGAPRTHPMNEEAVIYNPQQNPHPPGGAATAPTAQAILAAFIDWDRASGGKLTKRVTGQLAKIIATLLAEGVDDRYIRTGLAAWREKEMHPSTLDSFVSAAMNGHRRQRRPSTGDRAIAEAAALKEQLRHREELA
jgi:hypothetical protein